MPKCVLTTTTEPAIMELSLHHAPGGTGNTLRKKELPMEPEIQKRIYPEMRIQQRKLIARILGVLFALIGLGVMVGIGLPSFLDEPSCGPLMFVLVPLVFIYAGLYAAGLDPREWVLALINRRTWQRLQVTAEGEILDRTVREHRDSEGDTTYTYWVTFRFDTAEGPVTLQGLVDKGYYERLRKGDSIMVRYALENPRLALLEGEWKD
jgi:hypothetical protein